MSLKNASNAALFSHNDTKITAARNAEEQLFDYYGLQAKDHYVELPGHGIKVRVSGIGNSKPVVIIPGNTGNLLENPVACGCIISNFIKKG